MLDYYHFYETRSGTSEPHLLWSPELRKEAIRSWGEPLTNCVARADCKENPSVFPPEDELTVAVNDDVHGLRALIDR